MNFCQSLLRQHTLMLVVLAILAICSFDIAWAQGRLAGEISSIEPVQEMSSFSSQTLTGVITLQQILHWVVTHNPGLKALSSNIREKESRVIQASRLPNPEIEIEVEEFGGSDNRTGFDTAQSTFRISQLFLLGDKRSKATEVANLNKDSAAWGYQSKRLDIQAHASKAFFTVLEAQKRLDLANGNYQLAQEVFDVVSERVRAGKVSPVEQTKAEVTLATSEIELDRAKQKLNVARSVLAAMWGSGNPSFKMATGDIETINKPIPLTRLHERILGNPDLARWQTELELSRAAIELEQADAIPDLTVSAGIQRFEETDDSAYIVGLSIPVPLFNRNRGGIQAAQHNLEKSMQERLAVETEIIAALSQAYQRLSLIYNETEILKNKILPAASNAFHATREGYKQGKSKYLDVLDAQRTLFEMEARYISSVATYQRARIDMERLVGEDLTTANGSL